MSRTQITSESLRHIAGLQLMERLQLDNTLISDEQLEVVDEPNSLTPETMSEIQFELAATPDGGAEIGLRENHPDAFKAALSDHIYIAASQYLPLVKQYEPGWKRSLSSCKNPKAVGGNLFPFFPKATGWVNPRSLPA